MVKWIDCGKRPDAYSAAAFIQGIQMLFHIGHLLHFKCETRNLFFAGINETGKPSEISSSVDTSTRRLISAMLTCSLR